MQLDRKKIIKIEKIEKIEKYNKMLLFLVIIQYLFANIKAKCDTFNNDEFEIKFKNGK